MTESHTRDEGVSRLVVTVKPAGAPDYQNSQSSASPLSDSAGRAHAAGRAPAGGEAGRSRAGDAGGSTGENGSGEGAAPWLAQINPI